MTGEKTINLALQGGGSHGAFTWGVLDAVLEDGRLAFDSVSGTSAGAMNAVALAAGYADGGREGARESLRTFWKAISSKGWLSPLRRTPWDIWTGNWSLENSPGYQAYNLASRMYSPYDLNPLDVNPLRDLVEETVDFDRVNSCNAFGLFISATNVLTGKVRVFARNEVSLDAVMASACLPTIYKAVEIDGVPYWDGGFGGNPALFPFFYESEIEDCLLIQINPIERFETPQTAQEIQDRVNEITFNSALLREFRAIEFVRRLSADGRLDGTDYSVIRMHRVSADAAVLDLSASSKLNTEWAFLNYLFELGRAAALDFLEENFDDIGQRATLDLTDELSDDVFPEKKAKSMSKRMRELIGLHSRR
ncbi:MAG: patatin-like phospholipase family protein [Pseudomonadota bacterium]